MAKSNRTGRSSRTLSPFIAMERYILDSPAWLSLLPVERCTYWELLRLYNGSNNGRVALSARSLTERLRISRATAARAFVVLVERGFVEAVRQGGFNLKSGERRATEWRLTCYRCDVTGATPSKAFMRWQEGKIHFSASPQGHNGFTTEPPTYSASPISGTSSPIASH